MEVSLIESLPSELLDSILVTFPTPKLIALASVSRHFHDHVARILYRRLRKAVSLPSYQLILECYHPSAKLSTPYLYCDYVGTDGLDVAGYEHTCHLGSPVTCYTSTRHHHGLHTPPSASRSGRSTRTSSTRTSRAASPDPAHDDPESLHHFLSLYSRFRPEPQAPAKARTRSAAWQRPSAMFRLQTHNNNDSNENNNTENTKKEPAAQDIHLDGGELFSQLCVATNLVKTGPQRDHFLSSVNISDGIVRVWRDWLASRAEDDLHHPHGSSSSHWQNVHGGVVLWADADRNVGLRFRVRERESPLPAPLMVQADEDVPMSYTLEYDELLVRTSQLLLSIEESEEQQEMHLGHAVALVAS